MNEPEDIFRKSLVTHRITWLISIILSVCSIKFYKMTAWIPGYFYAAGIFAFYYSFSKYAEMNVEGIKIYLGHIFKKIELNIDWASIKSADYTTVEKRWRTNNHGVDTGLNAPDQEDEEGVLIIFSRDIKNEEVIKKNKELAQKLKLPDERRFLFLPYGPRGGFKKFLFAMQRYSKNNCINWESLKNVRSFKYGYIDWFIGVVATVLMAFNTLIL